MEEHWNSDENSWRYAQIMNINRRQGLTILNSALKKLLDHPEMTQDDPQVDPLLVMTCPPRVIERVLKTIRDQFGPTRHWTPSSSSSVPPASATLPQPQNIPVIDLDPVPAAVPQKRDADTTVEIVHNAMVGFHLADAWRWWPARNFAEATAYTNLEFCSLIPQNKGVMAVDKQGDPCSHYRRCCRPFIDLYKSQPHKLRTMDRDKVDILKDVVLRKFFQLRPEMMFDLEPPVRKNYAWLDSAGTSMDLIHQVGTWYYFALRAWKPEPPLLEMDMAARRFLGEPLTELIHASNMYTFRRSVAEGLKAGETAGRGSMIGVYGYRLQNHKPNALAKSSSGYGIYSDIGGVGIYYSTRFQIMISEHQLGMEGIAYGAGAGQVAVPDDKIWLTGVWVHAVTEEEVKSRGQDQALWFQADEWHQDMELALP